MCLIKMISTHFRVGRNKGRITMKLELTSTLQLVGFQLIIRLFVPTDAVTAAAVSSSSTAPVSTYIPTPETSSSTAPVSTYIPTPEASSSSTAPVSTYTPTPETSSSASLAGPIAGGVVGGVVVLGVFAGLLFVSRRKRKTGPNNEASTYERGPRSPLPGYYDDKDVPNTVASGGLRYVDDIPGETSGRVGGDY
jgi:hypothetical protein